MKYGQRGRPNKDEAGKKTYRITGIPFICLKKVEQAQNEKGLFIIATNDCSDTLNMESLLAHYKSQQSVERGFRFLKSPDFLTSSFYLKKPERIEALLMIMTCCLMLYAALEHLIRKKLQATSSTIPDMKRKPTQNPTARWVFYCFQGIDELTANEEIRVLNLKTHHRTILDSLAACFKQIYS